MTLFAMAWPVVLIVLVVAVLAALTTREQR